MDLRFEITGAGTPGWPPPRPAGEPPREEEYSRLLDPAKYLVLPARLAAWLDVLSEHGICRHAAVEDVGPMSYDLPLERGVRWLPAAPGALPLTVGFRSMDGVPDTVVELGVGEPVVWALVLPDCGCDACDTGSADLLDHLDGFVELVVTGGFLRVDTPGGHVQTVPHGWEATNLPDAEAVLAAARAGVGPHRVTTGAAWL